MITFTLKLDGFIDFNGEYNECIFDWYPVKKKEKKKGRAAIPGAEASSQWSVY